MISTTLHHLFQLIGKGVTCLFVTLAFWLVANESQSQDFNPPYPRLHANVVGVKTIDDAQLRVIARHQIATFGLWRTWNSNGLDVRTLPSSLKTYNRDIRILMTNPYVQSENTITSANRPVYEKMFAESGTNGRRDWWLRTASGEHINGYRASHWRRNISPVVGVDYQGRNPGQWHFQYMYASASDGVDRIESGFGMREGDWDGIYQDDQYLSSQFSPIADYDSDGVDDDPKNPKVQQWIIDGHFSHRDAMRAVQPNWIFAGNMSGYIYDVDVGKYEMPPSMIGLNDMGFFERANIVEKHLGWDVMMRRYRLGLSWLGGPRIGVFAVDFKTFRDNYPSAGFSNARWNRYGLCSALMDDGFYQAHDSADGEYKTVSWFDEFWGGSLKTTGYLGYPVQSPQLAPWSNGVYRREFTNGLVLVNPKGNGRRTVNVGPGWKRILGIEDQSFNNGQTTSVVTLDEQDGIVLLREKPMPRPNAPSEVAVN